MGKLNVLLTYFGLPPIARSFAVYSIYEYKEDKDGYVFRREYPRLRNHPNSGSPGTRWSLISENDVPSYVKAMFAKRN